ncbi:COP9 signalosome complex subunit 8 [Trebouxia sp. C0010 RCD-2024]
MSSRACKQRLKWPSEQHVEQHADSRQANSGREQEISLSDLVHIAEQEQRAWFQDRPNCQAVENSSPETSTFRIQSIDGSLVSHEALCKDGDRHFAVISIACGEAFDDGALDESFLHWACTPRQGGPWEGPPPGWTTEPDSSLDAGKCCNPVAGTGTSLALAGTLQTGGIAFVLKTGQQQWLASRAEGVLRSDFFISTQQAAETLHAILTSPSAEPAAASDATAPPTPSPAVGDSVPSAAIGEADVSPATVDSAPTAVIGDSASSDTIVDSAPSAANGDSALSTATSDAAPLAANGDLAPSAANGDAASSAVNGDLDPPAIDGDSAPKKRKRAAAPKKTDGASATKKKEGAPAAKKKDSASAVKKKDSAAAVKKKDGASAAKKTVGASAATRKKAAVTTAAASNGGSGMSVSGDDMLRETGGVGTTE